MNKDVKCPYCQEWNYINHDDGYGYEEDEVYEQECGHCEKTFCYTTAIFFSYTALECPCKNGGEHDLKPLVGLGFPEEYYKSRFFCSYCGETIIKE